MHTLAVHVPSKHAVPAILDQVQQHYASSRMECRRAALDALAVTAEGCNEAYSQKLDAL